MAPVTVSDAPLFAKDARRGPIRGRVPRLDRNASGSLPGRAPSTIPL